MIPAPSSPASSLNSRASDLNRLLDSVGLAVQTLEAADAGLSAITDLVETAQATARQARQSAGPVTPVTAATLTGTVDLGVDVAATTTGTVDLGSDTAAAIDGAGSSADLTTGGTALSDGVITVTNTTTGATDTLTLSGGTGTVSDLTTFLSGLSSSTDITGAVAAGELDFDADNNNESVTITVSTSALQGEIGLAATQSADPTNATVAALTGAATLQIGTNAAVTLDFDSAITNRTQLEATLSGLTGGTATVNGSNFIEVTATNNTDSIVTGGCCRHRARPGQQCHHQSDQRDHCRTDRHGDDPGGFERGPDA